jgi:hypothetical protein
MGFSYSYAESELDFDVDRDLEFSDASGSFRKHAVNMSLQRLFAERWSVELGLGAVTGGEIVFEGREFDLGPGWQAVLALSVRVLDGDGYWPFVLLSGSFGVGEALTEERGLQSPGLDHFVSLDGRGGLTVGKTFASTVSPYVSIRGFDLPLFWEVDGQDVLGADAHLYQGALGVVITPVERADLLLEVAPLGERAFSIGAGWSF